MQTSEIVIQKSDLLQALKTLQLAASGKNPPDVVIYSEPDGLGLHIGGTVAVIKGRGYLFGQGRISGKLIKNFKQLLPNTEEIIFKQDTNHLCIGNIKIACKWETPEAVEIIVPLNATWINILGLGYKYTHEEIEKSGLSKKYESAINEREKRIDIAFEALADMGVTRDDIGNIVIPAIKMLNHNYY